MESSTIITLSVVGVVILLVFYLVAIYNRLVTLKNLYQNAFAQIEVQLKRRYDLIPNLVEIAKGYMKHERETLDAVISARNEAAAVLNGLGRSGIDGAAVAQLAGAESNLLSAMGGFKATMEAYPDLKANENMQQLTEEMTTTENRISFARQGYNDSVMGYNTYRQSAPPVIFAGMFGHPNDATLLEFEDSEQIQEAPKVSF